MLRLLSIGAVAISAIAVPAAADNVDIQRQKAPNGLTGWLSDFFDPGAPDYKAGEVAGSLTIARKGVVVRKIEGGPTIWRWKFQSAGKTVAYISGPLHFSAECNLADIATGKKLGSLDCFTYPDNPPAGGWPAWVKDLEQ